MQDKMKCNNIHTIGISEEEQGIENMLKKVIMEIFPNLMKENTHKSRKQRWF